MLEPAPTPLAVRDWPLVGRAIELARIAAARADPECPAVVLAGPAGVGRSRMAREAHAAAEQRGELVYWAQGTKSSAGIPLGAFAALIPDETRGDDPLELIRRSGERVRARAEGRQVTVVVDDAHLLDPASAALVLHLATAVGVFVVATVCDSELVPDAVDSLWKDAGAPRIELSPLPDAAIESLLEAVLAGPVEQLFVRRVVDGSAGNVLYAREIILGALEEGRLTFDRGLWRLARTGVSSSLAALITARIGRLGDEERGVLELLALGQPLRLNEVLTLANAETLEGLEASGMVTVDAGRTDAVVRIAQPLYGEVLGHGLPVLRRRRLNLQLAEVVGARVPLTPDDGLRVARWQLEAGVEVPEERLLEAARAAVLAGDAELATGLSERAVANGTGLPATLVLARAHLLAGRLAEAEAVLAAAESDAAGVPEAAEYVAQRVHVLYWGLRQVEAARAFLERSAQWSRDSAWVQELDPWWLVLSGVVEGGGLPAGAELDATAAAPGEAGGQRATGENVTDSTWIAVADVFRRMALGHVKEADALIRAIRPQAPLSGDHDAYALGLQCIVGLEGGEDWPDLECYLTELLRDGVRAGDHQAAGLAAFTLGAMEMARGRYRDARRWLAEADRHFESQDAFGTAFSTRALGVGIAFFTGDPAGARDGLATVHALLGGRPAAATEFGYLARAEGWGARALSDSAGAQSFIDAAAATEQPNLAARLLYEALRAGAAPGPAATELRRLAERCDARLVAAYAAHAAALAAKDGNALLAAADEFVAIGTDVYALEAAVDAARRFVAEGRTDSARRAAARARELYQADQGAEFPVVDGLDGVALELTRREAQIAALAGRGLSNQEIAEQLVLSVRSVETYVYRAMQKRGVTSRHEL